MKTLIIIGVILIVCVVLILFYWEATLLSIGDFLVIQDELQPADVIHVIAGPDYRTEYAIQLYKQGYAKYIFFTGGYCIRHGYNHGDHGKHLALERGISMNSIALDNSHVTSTYSEAQKLKEFIDENPTPIESVIVVSDPHHMRRVRWTYRKLLGEGVDLWMAPVPFGQTPYKQHWLADGASQRYVKEEYIKLVYYLLRYKYSSGWVSDWLASLDKD